MAEKVAGDRRFANSLGIGFLGPVFGALPSLGRVFGAPEGVVENLAQINMDLGFSPMGVRRISPVPLGRPGVGQARGAPLEPVKSVGGGFAVDAVKPKMSKAEQMKANKKNGDEFAKKETEKFKSEADKVESEITIKANDGTKTRVDAIGVDKETGSIRIQEYKASETAPLTPNQTITGPLIEQDGGVVVGRGKGEFPGGTVIPPTRIEIVRPPKR